MLAWIVAAVLALATPAVTVVDDDGRPVSATVRFVAANGAVDAVRADASGAATPDTGFAAASATVDAPGFVSVTVTLAGTPVRVVLHRVTPVIGAVRVATGSVQSLHRLPFSASVLDATAIRDSPARTSDALLRDLPGFDRDRSNSMFTNYGQLRVSFDGAGNDRGVVLADGLPAQDAFGGQVDWIAYPPGEIARAELLRGAGSALYGSGAVGGVLALDTRAPPSSALAPPQGFVALGGGGLGASDAQLFYATPVGARLAASLWTSTLQEAYKDQPPGYLTPVDQVSRSQGDATQLRLRTIGGPSTFDASVLFSTDAQAEGRPNYSFGRTLQQFSLGYAHAGERATTSVQTYVRDTTVLNVADQFPTTPGVLRYVQHVPTFESGVFASWLLPGEHLDLEARADAREVHGISDQRGAGGVLQSLGSGTQAIDGVAFQARLHGGPFEALLGARYDAVTFADGVMESVSKGVTTTTDAPTRTDEAVSPRVALRYDLSPSVALRASSGGGFRAPFLNELLRGFQVGAVTEAPNIALVPERSGSDSVGFDDAGGRSRLAFDVTDTRVNDAIAFVTLTPTLQQRQNVSHTRTDGADATFTTLLSACTRLRVAGQTQYARVIAGPAASVGKRLAYVPDREATVGIDTSSGSARFGADASFLGAAFADDLNTEPLNSALLIGAHVTTPLASGATLTLDAENLTNRVYLSSVDRLGPPGSLNLRVTFPLGARPTTAPPPRC